MVSRPRVDRPEDDLARFFRRVDRTEVTAPLRSSSVHDGRTRFVGPLTILVQGSGLVDGAWIINGHLQGAGEINWAGLWNMIGNGKIFGDVELLADGKLIAGGLVIDPSGGGSITFPTGARLEVDPDAGGARLIVGNAVMNVGEVSSIRKADSSVMVSALGITVHPAAGTPVTLDGEVRIPLAYVPELSDTGLPIGTAIFGAGGVLSRSDGT